MWFLPISCQSRTSSQVQSLSAFVLVLLCLCTSASIIVLLCFFACVLVCLCCLFPSPAKATPLLKSRGCFNVKSLCALPVFVCVLSSLVHDPVCFACLPPFRFPVCLPSDRPQHLPACRTDVYQREGKHRHKTFSGETLKEMHFAGSS